MNCLISKKVIICLKPGEKLAPDEQRILAEGLSSWKKDKRKHISRNKKKKLI